MGDEPKQAQLRLRVSPLDHSSPSSLLPPKSPRGEEKSNTPRFNFKSREREALTTMAASKSCAAPSLPTYWCLELIHECFPELALPPLPPRIDCIAISKPYRIYPSPIFCRVFLSLANSFLVSEMVAGAPEGYRNRVELRALETWLESVDVPEDPTPPAPAAGASPPSCVISTSRSAHEVLRGLQLISETYGPEGIGSLAYDVRKYIHDKTASLPKLCVHLLKEVDLGLRQSKKTKDARTQSKKTKDVGTTTSNQESSPCVLHRKRVHWTEDEVKALKYFAGAFRKGQNIPWRKIKKYGADIFHQERSPTDLKDKWKNLKKRALTP